MRFLICVCWAGLASGQVVISQVYGGGGNTGATFRNDYIELFNRGASEVDLTGWSVQYASATGDTWQTTALGGTLPAGRYLLVAQAAGAGGTADLPAAAFSGTIAMSATTGKVAVVGPEGIADLVGYGTATRFEGSGPAPAPSNTMAVLRKGAGCVDTDNNAADFVAGAPAPRNAATPAADCSAAGPSALRTTIEAVQGSGRASPLLGQLVSVTGVVTGRRSNGFWMQSLEGDGDVETSDGIFVFTSSAPPPGAARGNRIEVAGTVAEFNDLTELTGPAVTILGEGAPLPVPALPRPGEDWERYEGMRVQFTGLRVVAPTLGSVNEAAGTATSSGVFFAAPATAPRPFFHPSGSTGFGLLRVDSRAQGGAAATVETGARIAELTGPLDFAFDNYTIAPDPAGPIAGGGGRGPAVQIPRAADREFTIASMNLQRLFDDVDDPGADVVVPAEAVQRRIARIARAIREVLHSPDVIAVQEAENLAVLRALAAAAGDYEPYLFEGNDPSGIDNGLLLKRGRVVATAVTQEGKDQRVDGSNPASPLANDRPPLMARLTVDGVRLTVIAVHNRSLIGAGDGGPVDAKRRAQVEFLTGLVRAREAAGEPVVVLGDFNATQYDPLPPGVNLVNLLPQTENYSYVFDGRTQTLDHVLVSPSLLPRITRFRFARVNADYPEVYRSDAARLERYADHDVPVVYVTAAGPDSTAIAPLRVTNAATGLSGPVAANEIVTIAGTALAAAPANTRVLLNGTPLELVFASGDTVRATMPATLAAGGTAELQLEVGGRRTNTIVVETAEASPGIFTLPGGRAAVLNQDYSLNGPAQAAPRGSIVMIYGTGVAEGTPARVWMGGHEAEVLYSGQAPGLVRGAVQINARVPDALPPGEAMVLVAAGEGVSAPGVSIAVR